jgi:hypothetical protein
MIFLVTASGRLACVKIDLIFTAKRLIMLFRLLLF